MLSLLLIILLMKQSSLISNKPNFAWALFTSLVIVILGNLLLQFIDKKYNMEYQWSLLENYSCDINEDNMDDDDDEESFNVHQKENWQLDFTYIISINPNFKKCVTWTRVKSIIA